MILRPRCEFSMFVSRIPQRKDAQEIISDDEKRRRDSKKPSQKLT